MLHVLKAHGKYNKSYSQCFILRMKSYIRETIIYYANPVAYELPEFEVYKGKQYTNNM